MIQEEMSRFRGIFKHETGVMQEGLGAEEVFLAVGDDGPFHFQKKADPRGDEKDAAQGRGEGKSGDVSHWVEDV